MFSLCSESNGNLAELSMTPELADRCHGIISQYTMREYITFLEDRRGKEDGEDKDSSQLK